MDIINFLAYLNRGEAVEGGSEMHKKCMNCHRKH